MGIHRGPNPVNDGLVFGCDTGYGIADNSTATRFYPGKPTSNALETEVNWIYLGTNITNPADYPVALPAEVDFQKGASQGSISWSDACRNYADSYSAGTKITVSGWHMFYSTDTSLTMNSRDRLGWHYSKDGVSTYGGTIYTATQWNKWYYFSSTFSSTGVTTNLRVEDGGADYYRSSEDAAKTTQYYCNLQIEVGTDIVSPYVKGTRSSTASLIDLKRATNIDVSNVSFDSTGQPTFDNTSDRITMPNSSVFNHTSELSIEAWVKFDGNSEDFIFEKGNVNTQYSLFSHGTDIVFRTIHAGVSGYHTLSPSKTTAGITNGQWHHIVGSWDGSTKRIYVDGVDKASVSKSGALTTTSNGAAIGSFGGTSSGYYFGGDIAIVKIYDKGLSAAEVKQNYNSQKNRFDI